MELVIWKVLTYGRDPNVVNHRLTVGSEEGEGDEEENDEPVYTRDNPEKMYKDAATEPIPDLENRK